MAELEIGDHIQGALGWRVPVSGQDVEDHLVADGTAIKRLPDRGLDRFQAIGHYRCQHAHEAAVGVITAARDYGLVTKSNLILGMGETPEEVRTALVDLHEAGCDIVTITQYLRPSPRHHPVERWVRPEEFVEHSDYAKSIGFTGVLAGPLVRSSYRAGKLYAEAARVRAATGAS